MKEAAADREGEGYGMNHYSHFGSVVSILVIDQPAVLWGNFDSWVLLLHFLIQYIA